MVPTTSSKKATRPAQPVTFDHKAFRDYAFNLGRLNTAQVSAKPVKVAN